MGKIRQFEPISSWEDKFLAEGSTCKLPKRSTKNSAGYDFYAAEDIVIPSHLIAFFNRLQNPLDDNNDIVVKPFCIPTRVKAYMQDDEVLELYIRSSSPSKLGLVMANSVGIIDSDYYNNPDNEGHIGFLVYNLTTKPIQINKGEKIGQGIFKKYLKVDYDNVIDERIGGYGSTGK